MKMAYCAKEIGEALGLSERTIRKRAIAGSWGFQLKKVKHTRKKYFNFDSLPKDVKFAVITYQEKTESSLRLPAAATNEPLCQAQIDNALAKADLVRHYVAHLKKAAHGKKGAARDEFMVAYNSGLAFSKLYDVLSELSWKTLEQWKRALSEKKDALELADRRGYWRRHQRVLSADQEKILLRCALHPNRPKLAEVIRMARAVMNTRGLANGFSDATYRRFLNDWRDRNYHIWVFSRQGAKAWNDKCAFYIERDYSLINVGDVLVADGHTLNFEILNPWTGKPKRMILILWMDMKSSFPLGWEIMPTENTQAIASALRRAILRLGKYPQVAYLDNGKAFSGRFFNGADLEHQGFSGLFERLGMKTIFAWPYHGQSKTVERFFGSFAELERWCPTYTGTSIEKKPPRMLRGERLHRRAYEKMIQGDCLTLEQAHRAIAAWFDDYVQRPQQHGHLKDQRPIDIFVEEKGPGVDAAELQYLMMSEKVRHIRRNGIRFLGNNYYHPELYGRRHPVMIRYDLQDESAIWVFDRDGRFLGQADRTDKVHPAATALGTADDQAKLNAHIKMKKAQEKEASVMARTFLEEEVLPQHKKYLAALGVADSSQRIAGNEAIPQITETSEEEERRILAEVAERERWNAELPEEVDEDQQILAEIEGLKLMNENMKADELRLKLERMSETDRYETLMEMDVQGQMLPRRWRAFMDYFELTDDYERFQDYFEERRSRLAVVYQTEVNSGGVLRD